MARVDPGDFKCLQRTLGIGDGACLPLLAFHVLAESGAFCNYSLWQLAPVCKIPTLSLTTNKASIYTKLSKSQGVIGRQSDSAQLGLGVSWPTIERFRGLCRHWWFQVFTTNPRNRWWCLPSIACLPCPGWKQGILQSQLVAASSCVQSPKIILDNQQSTSTKLSKSQGVNQTRHSWDWVSVGPLLSISVACVDTGDSTLFTTNTRSSVTIKAFIRSDQKVTASMQGTVGIGRRLAHRFDEMTPRGVSWNGSVAQLLVEPISSFVFKLLQQLGCNIRCSATPKSAMWLLELARRRSYLFYPKVCQRCDRTITAGNFGTVVAGLDVVGHKSGLQQEVLNVKE